MLNRHRQIQKNLALRSKIFQAIRDFFNDHGYLEVDTPERIPAPAPEPFIDAMPANGWYLQTSPELCMKRLLAAGYPKIFQICKCFRKNERGEKHLPEFTMLEWYEADATYFDLMARCEALILFICRQLQMPEALSYQTRQIDLRPPWPKLSVKEAFDRFSSMDIQTAITKDKFDEIIAFDIEPNLGVLKPVFLYDYPASTAMLAAPKPDNPDIAQRFELYIAGLELCNGFTELTDADKQRNRFAKELNNKKNAGQKVYPMPEKFLTALNLMPEASGNAMGLDRLIMLFAGTACIDDVVAFTPEDL